MKMNNVYLKVKKSSNEDDCFFAITYEYAKVLARVIKETIFDDIREDDDEDMGKISSLISIYRQIMKAEGETQHYQELEIKEEELKQQEIEKPCREEIMPEIKETENTHLCSGSQETTPDYFDYEERKKTDEQNIVTDDNFEGYDSDLIEDSEPDLDDDIFI